MRREYRWFYFLDSVTLTPFFSVMNMQSLYHERHERYAMKVGVSHRTGSDPCLLRPAPGSTSPRSVWWLGPHAAVQRWGSDHEERDGHSPVTGNKGQGPSSEEQLGSRRGWSLRNKLVALQGALTSPSVTSHQISKDGGKEKVLMYY